MIDNEIGCVISYFYIKPQPPLFFLSVCPVVSYLISTSNHNCKNALISQVNVVSYLISTSNHNFCSILSFVAVVVSYLISTSNHNRYADKRTRTKLCHILFLHQTTTPWCVNNQLVSCVISYFYIKPQPPTAIEVVVVSCVISYFYIKPQLWWSVLVIAPCCVISYFYIKPQRW